MKKTRATDPYSEIGQALGNLVRLVERLRATAGNYVADREIEPRQVTFADGRIVRVVGDGHLVIEQAKMLRSEDK